MDATSILTLDIGTSSVRALFWNSLGQEITADRVQIPYRMHTTPDGGVELPAPQLLQLVTDCLDQALSNSSTHPASLRAVGVTTFWHSLLGLDTDGKPITPLYSWADNRSAPAARRLRDTLDEQAIHARTGCMLHPSYYPAKLCWLRETQPDTFYRVAHWVSPAEYLFGELFGEEARQVSVSMASGTGLFNQSACEWDSQTLEALDLSPTLFSALTDLRDCPRGLAAPFAQRWPSLSETPFLPAVGDGACGNVGSGCLTPERFAINLGTSGAIRALWSESRSAPASEKGVASPPGLWRYRVDRKRPAMGAAFSDGGHVYAYMQRTLQLPDQGELEPTLAAMTPGAHGLTFLPFLAGERSLGWNPDSRAAILGMNLDTSPLEIVRCAMEAVALQFTEAAARLRTVFPEQKEIIASGGAFGHLPFWAQMFADALGQPVTLTQESEATSRGAALLAMEAVGMIASPADLPPKLGETYEPNDAHYTVYLELLAHQNALYEKLFGQNP